MNQKVHYVTIKVDPNAAPSKLQIGSLKSPESIQNTQTIKSERKTAEFADLI